MVTRWREEGCGEPAPLPNNPDLSGPKALLINRRNPGSFRLEMAPIGRPLPPEPEWRRARLRHAD